MNITEMISNIPYVSSTYNIEGRYGYNFFVFKLKPRGYSSPEMVIKIPIPTKLRIYKETSIPYPREILCETGSVRLLAQEISCDDNDENFRLLSYENVIEDLIQKNIRDISFGADRAGQGTDGWVGVLNLIKEIKEYIYSMPIKHRNNSWNYVMGNRITIKPKELASSKPDEREEMLIESTNQYFGGLYPTSMSDGMRYMGTFSRVDIRNYVPFSRFHNPKRPITQMLTEKECLYPNKIPVEETPILLSEQDAQQCDGEFCNKGMNLVTALLDIPLTFEDQIVVSDRYRDLISVDHQQVLIYGDDCRVVVGSKVFPSTVIGVNRDGNEVFCKGWFDEGIVQTINATEVQFAGVYMPALSVTVEVYHSGRNGRKYTNRHGGKGVVVYVPQVDMPVVVLPNGQTMDVDIIVGAASTGRRGNVGQVLEICHNMNRICDSLRDTNTPIPLNDIVRDLSVTNLSDRYIHSLKPETVTSDFVPELKKHPVIYKSNIVNTFVGPQYWMVIEDPTIIYGDQPCEEDEAEYAEF